MEMNRELWEPPCKCTSTTLVSGGPFPVARWIITMFLPRVRVLMWGAFGPPQVLFMAMIYSLKEQTGPDKTIWFLIDLITSQFTMHIYINSYDEALEKFLNCSLRLPWSAHTFPCLRFEWKKILLFSRLLTTLLVDLLPEKPLSSSSSELCSLSCMADCLSNWYAFVSIQGRTHIHTHRNTQSHGQIFAYKLGFQLSGISVWWDNSSSGFWTQCWTGWVKTQLSLLKCWYKLIVHNNSFHETLFDIAAASIIRKPMIALC